MESRRLWTDALHALNGLAGSTGFAMADARCDSMYLATVAGRELPSSFGDSPGRTVSPACTTP
jgi:hypothetical protein